MFEAAIGGGSMERSASFGGGRNVRAELDDIDPPGVVDRGSGNGVGEGIEERVGVSNIVDESLCFARSSWLSIFPSTARKQTQNSKMKHV